MWSRICVSYACRQLCQMIWTNFGVRANERSVKWVLISSVMHLFYCRISVCQENHYNSWWRHQMETISALLALCAGNSPVPVNFPHKGQWRGGLKFSLICARINDWVNNREAGNLRRHHGHYDISVMYMTWLFELVIYIKQNKAHDNFYYCTRSQFNTLCHLVILG